MIIRVYSTGLPDPPFLFRALVFGPHGVAAQELAQLSAQKLLLQCLGDLVLLGSKPESLAGKACTAAH